MRKISKENAFSGVVNEFAFPFTRRANPNTTTEGTKARKILLFAGMKLFVGGEVASTCGIGVLGAKIKMKSIRPELGWEIGTSQERTNALPNRLIGTFHRCILM
jgi:hypothetical protein